MNLTKPILSFLIAIFFLEICFSINVSTPIYSSWQVYAGSHDLSLTEEPNRVVIEATESYIHPDWNPATVVGDIALIKLSQKVELNGLISCL